MINKIITLFKIARKLAQSDAMEIISKLHEPPKIIKFFFYLLSFSFSNPKKENNNLNEEQKLCNSIQEMGTTFIKLGQFLSTRPDIIGIEIAKKLENLQDKLPPFSSDEAKKDPDFAPLKVFDIIGYAKTATSPVEAEPLKYLRPEDKKIMNRNSLLAVSKKILDDNKDFKAPEECKFNLSGKLLKEKMIKVLEKLYNEKVILDHGVEVGKELANVLSGGDTTIDKTLSEDDLYKLELDSFMRLIKTKKTQDRIKHTLVTGKPLIN